MRARPAGPAESSVFHNFARGGPTKEADPRALNQLDGLLRSVAGQGYARFVRVTLPRGASDQHKRTKASVHCPLTPEGPILGVVGRGAAHPPFGLRCWWARAAAGSSSEAQYSRRLSIRGPSKVSSATSRMRLRTCWAVSSKVASLSAIAVPSSR